MIASYRFQLVTRTNIKRTEREHHLMWIRMSAFQFATACIFINKIYRSVIYRRDIDLVIKRYSILSHFLSPSEEILKRYSVLSSHGRDEKGRQGAVQEKIADEGPRYKVLVRYLVRNDKRQAERASAYIREATAEARAALSRALSFASWLGCSMPPTVTVRKK